MSDELELVRAAAERLRPMMPRGVTRDGGELGEAWEMLAQALESAREQYGPTAGQASQPASERPQPAPQPAPADRIGAPDPAVIAHVGLVMAAAARLDRAVEQCGDDDVAEGWDLLLDMLLGGGLGGE